MPLAPQASPIQVESYMATRRYYDNNWNSDIQKYDNPAELQRQQIYLMRDLLYVEYQRQLLDERVLATLSLIQLNLTISPADCVITTCGQGRKRGPV